MKGGRQLKLTSGVEQAACIIVMLSTQAADIPVTSDVISERLGVSPSYLKKIMRKLVVRGLIKSVPGVNGGFVLAKTPACIPIIDLVDAIEGNEPIFQSTGLVRKAFGDIEVAEKGFLKFENIVNEAQEAFRAKLSDITVEKFLQETIDTNEIQVKDWNQKSDEDND